MPAISTIVVPTDFGAPSLEALDWAVALASDLGASVVVVHAHQPPPPIVPLADAVTFAPDRCGEGLAEIAAESLREVQLRREGRGVALRGVLRRGAAVDVITEVADEVHADLIVLGVPARRGILRTLLGSVADRVAHSAAAPVLRIRVGEHRPHDEQREHGEHDMDAARAHPHAVH
jgi:nucleotide-binding universal stress UspA family protein